MRDLVLDRTPRELDIVVEGDPTIVARALGPIVRAHERFGTLTVERDGHRYDIARARRERYARPGALPEVEPAGLPEDLRRRDFTVNALAVALNGPEAGSLTAVSGGEPPFDALDDLEHGVLRVLHAASFLDDPTRLLRLARYAGRLGFDPDPVTATLAAEAVRSGALATVSGPRIGTELRLLSREAEAPSELAVLDRLGIGAAIGLPAGHDAPELARRALALLPDDACADLTVMAAAGLGLPGERLEALLDHLAYPAANRTVIARAASGAQETARRLAAAERPSQIDAAAGHAPPEQVALAGALGPAEAARRWLNDLRHVGLEITGADLEAAGIPRGRTIGTGLQAARAAALDGRANGRDQQLQEALRAAQATG